MKLEDKESRNHLRLADKRMKVKTEDPKHRNREKQEIIRKVKEI